VPYPSVFFAEGWNYNVGHEKTVASRQFPVASFQSLLFFLMTFFHWQEFRTVSHRFVGVRNF